MKLRRGKLSLEERQTIEEKVLEGLSIAEIAQSLNRTEESIKNFAMTSEVDTGDSKKKTIITRLKSAGYWNTITAQLSRIEVNYFVDTFCELILQFGDDVLYSEELQIKQYIMQEILSNRALTKAKQYLETRDFLMEELNREKSLDSDREIIDDVAKKIQSCDKEYNQNMKVYLDTQDKADKVLFTLKGTRDQRIKTVSNGAESWSKLIELLNDDGIRQEVGREIELNRYAKEKVLQDLSKLHKFADDIPDSPILRGLDS